jgi:hypothetical protein
MPALDRTGPQGLGPLTGRGLGPCGRGMRRGAGICFQRGFGRPISLTQEEEKKILEAELKELELDKQQIDKRLKELE